MKRSLSLFAALLALTVALPVLAAEVPWTSLPNVEVSKLDDDIKARAISLMKEEACYHECEDTVFNCVTQSKPSDTALRAAGFITRQVIKGKPNTQIHSELMDRARSVHPFKTATFKGLRKSLMMGEAKAPVRIVVFADFDCPFCRVVSPMLRQMLPDFDGKVAYFFFFFPVKGHGPLAVETSRAGIAAADQKKFWEFHDIMYSNFEAHSESEIEGYAQKLGLDLERFKKVWHHDKTLEVVSASKKEGLRLGVKSTPTIYINGKRYFGEKTEVELRDRIEEEIALTN